MYDREITQVSVLEGLGWYVTRVWALDWKNNRQKEINRLLEQHKSGRKDCYKKVWTIYTFLVWYEQFFE